MKKFIISVCVFSLCLNGRILLGQDEDNSTRGIDWMAMKQAEKERKMEAAQEKEQKINETQTATDQYPLIDYSIQRDRALLEKLRNQQEAARIAAEMKAEKQQQADALKNEFKDYLNDVVKACGKGATKGAAMGALKGSIFPGVGTEAGAISGAGTGCITGVAKELVKKEKEEINKINQTLKKPEEDVKSKKKSNNRSKDIFNKY